MDEECNLKQKQDEQSPTKAEQNEMNIKPRLDQWYVSNSEFQEAAFVTDLNYMCAFTEKPGLKEPMTEQGAIECLKASKCTCEERQVTCYLGPDSKL